MLKDYEFAEIRNDLCKFDDCQIAELISKFPNIIFTERYSFSKQSHPANPIKGNGIITAIKSGVKYVDTEIEYPTKLFEIIKNEAHKHGTKLIVSYHDFKATPPLEQLKNIALQCKDKGADIIKIVTTSNNISDAIRTLDLYKCEDFKEGNFITNNGRPGKLAAFSMGDVGKFTRFMSLRLGSPFSYAAPSHGTVTAPGQFTINELTKLMEKSEIEFMRSNLSLLNIPMRTTIPCSKSIAQRAILGAILAKGKTTLKNYAPCNDITAAINVAEQLGCSIRVENDSTTQNTDNLIIESPGINAIKTKIHSHSQNLKLNIGESGLLTRMLMPLCGFLTINNNDNSIHCSSIEIHGKGSIIGRDMSVAFDALSSAGIEYAATEKLGKKYLPCKIHGGFNEDIITISGSASSQIVSGYLMTLPLLNHDTVLIVQEPKSIPYIELTLKVLSLYGIKISRNETVNDNNKIVFFIKGGQQYSSCEIFMDSDWSSASFILVAGAIISSLYKTDRNLSASFNFPIMIIENLHTDSLQADEAIISVLKNCGCKISVIDGTVSIANNSSLHAFDFDATDSPDLFPILTVLACFCTGKSRIKGVSRLFQKESNRAESIYEEFTILGADIYIVDDFMYICSNNLNGGDVHSHNDHRIAMSLAIAALFIPQVVKIDEIKCIDKSFPAFTEKLSQIFLQKER